MHITSSSESDFMFHRICRHYSIQTINTLIKTIYVNVLRYRCNIKRRFSFNLVLVNVLLSAVKVNN